ncbi:MAG: heterodisulfide reductase-related iron-sulfur binding cluster [Melioribacter sp.]|nr:heterodisulfide reductase-related iron-sulfur binding cluster [Melioribacter sp.]
MTLKNFVFVIVFIIAFFLFLYNLRRIIKYILLGQKEDRFNYPFRRIYNVLKIAFGQTKLLREPIAGIIHFLIFWGFIVFLLAVLESIIQGFYSKFSFASWGKFYEFISFIQDVFGLLVIISVLFALYRRFIQRVPRLVVDKEGSLDAAIILLLILGVVISMYGQYSSQIAQNNFSYLKNEFRPISYFLSKIIFIKGISIAQISYEVFWWIHIILIFSFLNFLPYSKHFHVISSIPNVYFSKFDEEKFTLKKINLEDENINQYGVADFEHLTWKQILDGYACTECGRCTDACPASNTGKKLSPREIIKNIRKRTETKAPFIINGSQESNGKFLIHDYISDEEVWACTTCGACVIECPVMIEHVDTIVDLRRNLVLMESNFPSELNIVFKNIETNFTPWSFNSQDRANWAEGMNIKTMAEDPNCEILFWVGCAGSFDARYQKVTKAIAKLMQNANIEFRILGTEEKCTGDTARRLGNEYLAQMLIQENIETLNKYNVKKIVTGCPHCYNTLKNEYPMFGGVYEVIHHTELIISLLKENKLKLNNASEFMKVTYHDSCYLGRYNKIYNAPRESLAMIENLEMIEMKRNKDRGFCCGAGGGRMFLEETEGKRINEDRTKEALDTGANIIASACPFCMIMISDGLKSLNKSEGVQVKDIAEIIAENLLTN